MSLILFQSIMMKENTFVAISLLRNFSSKDNTSGKTPTFGPLPIF